MTPSYAVFVILCGVLFVGLTIRHIIRGRRSAYWGGMAERESSPGRFWLTITLDATIAVAVLLYGIMGWMRS